MGRLSSVRGGHLRSKRTWSQPSAVSFTFQVLSPVDVGEAVTLEKLEGLLDVGSVLEACLGWPIAGLVDARSDDERPGSQPKKHVGDGQRWAALHCACGAHVCQRAPTVGICPDLSAACCMDTCAQHLRFRSGSCGGGLSASSDVGSISHSFLGFLFILMSPHPRHTTKPHFCKGLQG